MVDMNTDTLIMLNSLRGVLGNPEDLTEELLLRLAISGLTTYRMKRIEDHFNQYFRLKGIRAIDAMQADMQSGLDSLLTANKEQFLNEIMDYKLITATKVM